MPPVKFHLLPNPNGSGFLPSIPGAPNGNLATYQPNLWQPGLLGTALACWYRADVNLTTSGGRATSWAPMLSGIGPTLTQATAADGPLLTQTSAGLPALEPDAFPAYLASGASSMGMAYNTPMSVVIVTQTAAGGNRSNQGGKALLCVGPTQDGGLSLYSNGASGQNCGPIFSLGGFGYGNALIVCAGALPASDLIVLGFTYDGSGSSAGVKIYVNGQQVGTTVINEANGLSGNQVSQGQLTFGNTSAQYVSAQDLVGEFWIANALMSSTDMANAFQYYKQQI